MEGCQICSWHAWRNAIFLCRMFFCIRNIYLRNTQIIVILMWFIFFWGYYVTNMKFIRFKIVVFLNHFLTDYFLAEGIWKVHIFCHLFVCFQTSVYTLGEFHKNRNNSTVFEELSVSIVDLMVANIRFTGSVSRRQ